MGAVSRLCPVSEGEFYTSKSSGLPEGKCKACCRARRQELWAARQAGSNPAAGWDHLWRPGSLAGGPRPATTARVPSVKDRRSAHAIVDR